MAIEPLLERVFPGRKERRLKSEEEEARRLWHERDIAEKAKKEEYDRDHPPGIIKMINNNSPGVPLTAVESEGVLKIGGLERIELMARDLIESARQLCRQYDNGKATLNPMIEEKESGKGSLVFSVDKVIRQAVINGIEKRWIYVPISFIRVEGNGVLHSGKPLVLDVGGKLFFDKTGSKPKVIDFTPAVFAPDSGSETEDETYYKNFFETHYHPPGSPFPVYCPDFLTMFFSWQNFAKRRYAPEVAGWIKKHRQDWSYWEKETVLPVSG